MKRRNGVQGDARRVSLFVYMERLVEDLRRNGRVRTAETYRATLRSFRAYRGGADVRLGDLTSEMMEGFEGWHRRRGNTANTSSFYLRILRAVYRRAVDEGLVVENRWLFRRVYTGVDRTVKRAVSLGVISRLRALDLSGERSLAFARDMFLLSFYLRGMSFVDMAFLRKADLRGGVLSYRRKKTGRLLSIRWTREMAAIVGRYGENPTGYLLPIIRKPGEDERRAYLNAADRVNYGLRRLGPRVGVAGGMTMYVARHSWATAACRKGVPLSVISEGMGHDSERTTRIYLAELDGGRVDRANSLIIASV